MLELLPVDISYPIVAHLTLPELLNFDIACTLTPTVWAEWVKMGLTCSSAEITTKAEQSWCTYRGIPVIEYAMVVDNSNNNRTYVTWKRNGKLHHLYKPAYVVEYVDLFKLEYWYKEGKLHRDNGPAVVSTFYHQQSTSSYENTKNNTKNNTKKTSHLWYKHGVQQIKEQSKS